MYVCVSQLLACSLKVLYPFDLVCWHKVLEKETITQSCINISVTEWSISSDPEQHRMCHGHWEDPKVCHSKKLENKNGLGDKETFLVTSM